MAMAPERKLDKFRGCLVGLAIGDALGAPVEMMTASDIRLHYRWIDDYVDANRGLNAGRIRAGNWTDDTLMALATARGIVAAHIADPKVGEAVSRINSKFNLIDAIAAEHLADWKANPDSKYYGGTTRQALKNLESGIGWSASGVAYRPGNGAAMRIAPLALWFAELHPERAAGFENLPKFLPNLASLVDWAAHITHYSPYAKITAILQAMMVVRFYCFDEACPVGLTTELWMNKTYNDLLEAAKLLEKQYHADNIISTKIRNGKKSGIFRNYLQIAERVGTSAFAFESCPFSWITAITNAGSFKMGVLTAVNAGGDADTTGAMVGAILGAKFGLSGVPEKWVTELDRQDEIITIADRLFLATDQE